MAGAKQFSWIRVLKSDKERMEKYYHRRGITSRHMMFKILLRNKR